MSPNCLGTMGEAEKRNLEATGTPTGDSLGFHDFWKVVLFHTMFVVAFPYLILVNHQPININ